MTQKISLTFSNITDYYITQVNKRDFFEQEYQEFSKDEFLKLKTLKVESWSHKDGLQPRQYKYSAEFDYKLGDSEISHNCYFKSVSESSFQHVLFNEFIAESKNEVYNFVLVYARDLHAKYIAGNLSQMNYDTILPVEVEQEIDLDDINSMNQEEIRLRVKDVELPKLDTTVATKTKANYKKKAK